MLNFEILEKHSVNTNPFPYVIVPEFIKSDICTLIHKDYPVIAQSGSFPLQELNYGPYFQNFINELHSDRFRLLIEEKFNLNLTGLPTMTTVRGKCALKDGRIHTDSVTKIITVLIYMNGPWEATGGRLRLLKSQDNIDNYFMEVPPTQGTLLVFQVTPHSWHGHLPFEGDRRVIQFNWLTDVAVAKREIFRHRLSAKIKKLKHAIGL